jgi:hypothetical protein
VSVRPEANRSSPAEWSSLREVSVQREQLGTVELATDFVAEERPVALLAVHLNITGERLSRILQRQRLQD